MKTIAKIMLGAFMLATFAACNKSDNVKNMEGDEFTSDNLKPIAEKDIPKGFEHAHVCKEVHLPGETNPRGAVIKSKKWPNGSTISVRLYGGTTKARQKVMQYAQEWSKHANVKFNFVNTGTAQIRVTFVQGAGSYSYIGTDALQVPSNQETMNFGWFNDSTPEDDFSRTTIHEFGHALGMIHEHQHPLAAIPWNTQAVYAYYGGYPNYWTPAQVNTNIFNKYSTGQTQYSTYDSQSIMHYPISSQLTTNGYSVGLNSVLSATDKSFIAAVYPK